MDFILIALALRAGTSLVFAALGGILAERAGIMFLGLDGIMLSSGTVGFAVAFWSGSALLGLLAAMITGMVLGTVHAVLCLFFRANQVVTGLAINITGAGLASVLGQRLGPGGAVLVGLNSPRFERLAIPGLSDTGVGALLFSQDALTYLMIFLVVVVWFFLFRTTSGLNWRACGENPKAASSLGVAVIKTQLVAVLIGGVFTGMAGAHVTLAYSPGWTENFTNGRGWIAYALILFAGWYPARAAVGAVVFGAISALQFRLQLSNINIPPSFLGMLPFVMTLLVLMVESVWQKVALFGKFKSHSKAPAALGQPFWQE